MTSGRTILRLLRFANSFPRQSVSHLLRLQQSKSATTSSPSSSLKRRRFLSQVSTALIFFSKYGVNQADSTKSFLFYMSTVVKAESSPTSHASKLTSFQPHSSRKTSALQITTRD